MWRIGACVESYGVSLDGISRMAGTGLVYAFTLYRIMSAIWRAAAAAARVRPPHERADEVGRRA